MSDPDLANATPLGIGESIFGGMCHLPILVARERALMHNIQLMSKYCSARNVALAPHVKTTMCPDIARRQIHAGAWGITVATLPQVAALRRDGGFSRVLLANELVDEAGIKWIARELVADPEFEFMMLVDSLAGVRRLDEILTTEGLARQLRVLIEYGSPGGRCGCRTLDATRIVAEAVVASRHLELVGVEAYEGVVSRTADEGGQGEVRSFIREALSAYHALRQRNWLPPDAWFSAGGSVFFKEVVEEWAAFRDKGVGRLLLRSGCYVTHDSGRYHRLSPLDGRATSTEEKLIAALEVWGAVLSLPEPDLAIVGIGKRDASSDAGVPVPLKWQFGRALPEPIRDEPEVVGMYDHHLILRLAKGMELQVGGLVGVGISHPCTTIDKWRRVALVDDSYRILSWLDTEFH